MENICTKLLFCFVLWKNKAGTQFFCFPTMTFIFIFAVDYISISFDMALIPIVLSVLVEEECK